jgi:hypothetical protein
MNKFYSTAHHIYGLEKVVHGEVVVEHHWPRLWFDEWYWIRLISFEGTVVKVKIL